MEKGQENIEIKGSLRMAAGDRRQQILDVAVRLFSLKGFRGTTTKEIALAAGVNEAIIFRHFATKGELYAAIIDRKACSKDGLALQRALDEAVESDDDRRVFEEIAFRMLEFHQQDDEAMRLLMYSALEGHELAEMIFRQHVAHVFHRLATFIKRRVSEGKFRKVDPMTAVRAFIGMVIYHALTNKMFPHHARELLNIGNRQAAERFTDIFLASMLNHEYEGHRPRRKS